jgi:two-component system chemotaxis response regulator CheB
VDDLNFPHPLRKKFITRVRPPNRCLLRWQKVYKRRAIAVVLTGGDGDGSFGVQIIKQKGGQVIAQDRPTSQDFSMPETSIKTGDVDFILPLNAIAPKLIKLVGAGRG